MQTSGLLLGRHRYGLISKLRRGIVDRRKLGGLADILYAIERTASSDSAKSKRKGTCFRGIANALGCVVFIHRGVPHRVAASCWGTATGVASAARTWPAPVT